MKEKINHRVTERTERKFETEMTDLQKDPPTGKIIGGASAVHRQLGPGLLESVYESALLEHHGLKLDIVAENSLILELQGAERLDPLFAAISRVFAAKRHQDRSPDKLQ